MVGGLALRPRTHFLRWRLGHGFEAVRAWLAWSSRQLNSLPFTEACAISELASSVCADACVWMLATPRRRRQVQFNVACQWLRCSACPELLLEPPDCSLNRASSYERNQRMHDYSKSYSLASAEFGQSSQKRTKQAPVASTSFEGILRALAKSDSKRNASA